MFNWTHRKYKVSRIINLCYLLLFSFGLYAVPNVPHNIKSITIYEEQANDEIFELSDKNTIQIKITTSFHLVSLHEGHSNVISAMPCIVSATYKRIIDIPVEQVKNTIEKNYKSILKEVDQCMSERIKTEISNLNILYGEIINHGKNYSPPVPKDYSPNIKPLTFEEWSRNRKNEE